MSLEFLRDITAGSDLQGIKMIILGSLTGTDLTFKVIEGDLCAYAESNYSIEGQGVVEMTTPCPETGRREIKIVLIRDVGDFQVTYTEGRYVVDNKNPLKIGVCVDYVITKKQRGRELTASRWAESAREQGRVSERAVVLEDTAFSLSTYGTGGVGGFYIFKA